MAGPTTTPSNNNNKDNREDVPNDLPAMFRPPINRTMRVLDRSFFRKTVPLSAAAVYKASDIANVRRELMKSKDMLALPRLAAIREVKDAEGKMRRGVLLREGIRVDGMAVLPVYTRGYGGLLTGQMLRRGRPR